MAVKASAQITLYRVIDIESTTRYYLLQSSTLSTPSKPTTNPPSNLWTKTEPSYTEGSTKTLYFTDLTVFTNNTFKYSEVSKSSSYEAAKAAYNKAVAADKRVQAAETTITQNKQEIDLRAAAIEESLGDAEGRLTIAESSLQITADGLASVVERTDSNETEISSLKQTASGLEIELSNTKIDVDDAKKVATNFLGFDSNGVVVGDRTKSTLGKNVLIDSDSVDIRDGSTVLATFAANQIELGKNSDSSVIKLCNNLGRIENVKQSYGNELYLISDVYLGLKGDTVGLYSNNEKTKLEIANDGVFISHYPGGSSSTEVQFSYDHIRLNVYSSGHNYIDMAGVNMTLGFDVAYNTTLEEVQLRASGGEGSQSISFVGVNASGTAKYFNSVMTDDGRMIAANGFTVGSITEKLTNKVLWSGAYWPNASHTCTFSSSVTSQPHGIILVFSNYSNNAAQNTRFHCFYVPKQAIASHSGNGFQFNLFASDFSQACGKYLYISNTKLTGHNDNTKTGTGSTGIKYANNTFVIRYVIGV